MYVTVKYGSLTKVIIEGGLNPGDVVGIEIGLLPQAGVTRSPYEQVLPVELGPNREIDVPEILLWGPLQLQEIP